MLRRCHDLVGDGRIHQFCIRSGDREEFQFAARHTDMHKFDFTGLTELTDWLCQTDVPVYLTIDLDCLDPSAFPGTGTPEAGGVSFFQLGRGQHRYRAVLHRGHSCFYFFIQPCSVKNSRMRFIAVCKWSTL